MSKPTWEHDDEVEISDDVKETNQLIVYNDDVNSFEHVIETLMEVCKHTFEQAEQCTVIIHYKGKCSVKEGEFIELLDMKHQINSVGIDAKVV